MGHVQVSSVAASVNFFFSRAEVDIYDQSVILKLNGNFIFIRI